PDPRSPDAFPERSRVRESSDSRCLLPFRYRGREEPVERRELAVLCLRGDDESAGLPPESVRKQRTIRRKYDTATKAARCTGRSARSSSNPAARCWKDVPRTPGPPETSLRSPMADAPPPQRLARELGTFGAVMMGLGSIVGTGVFVSLGIAAGVAGPAVVVAAAVGALVATFNGLSSAQLAANHPVSGGTYEYGYRFLTPAFGFTAGWMFLVAKSASAATAA